jgi:hypothetical protein
MMSKMLLLSDGSGQLKRRDETPHWLALSKLKSNPHPILSHPLPTLSSHLPNSSKTSVSTVWSSLSLSLSSVANLKALMREGSKVCTSIVKCSSQSATTTFSSLALLTLTPLSQLVSSLTRAERNRFELPLTNRRIPEDEGRYRALDVHTWW